MAWGEPNVVEGRWPRREIRVVLDGPPGPTLTRDALAVRFRDWLHETPLSRCDAGSDVCETWPLAYELADLALAPPRTGSFVEVEDEAGRGVRAGRWRERGDGLWELVIKLPMGAAP